MLHLFEKVEAAASFIRARWNRQPKAGVILGTGLGNLVESMQIEAEIDYGRFPHFLNRRNQSSGALGMLRIGRCPCAGDGRSLPHVRMLFPARHHLACACDESTVG